MGKHWSELRKRHALVGAESLDISHEACHLVSAAAMSTPDGLSWWFKEGVPNVLALRAARARKLVPEEGEDPIGSAALATPRRLLEKSELAPVAKILRGDFGDMAMTARNRVAYALVRFLESRGLLEAVQAMAREPGNGQITAEQLATFAEEQARDLDTGFRKFLEDLSLRWESDDARLMVIGDEWLLYGTEKNGSLTWSLQAPPGPRYVVAGEIQVLSEKNESHPVALFVNRGRDRFYFVGFGEGLVTLGKCDNPQGKWDCADLASGDAPALHVNQKTPFRISLRPGNISVAVAGATVLDEELPRGRVTGSWGVQCNPDQAAIWTGVQITRQ